MNISYKFVLVKPAQLTINCWNMHILSETKIIATDNQNKISAAEYELNDRKDEYNEQNSFDDPSAVNRTNTGAATTKKAKFNYTSKFALQFFD